jgi:hypothetical protein
MPVLLNWVQNHSCPVLLLNRLLLQLTLSIVWYQLNQGRGSNVLVCFSFYFISITILLIFGIDLFGSTPAGLVYFSLFLMCCAVVQQKEIPLGFIVFIVNFRL